MRLGTKCAKQGQQTSRKGISEGILFHDGYLFSSVMGNNRISRTISQNLSLGRAPSIDKGSISGGSRPPVVCSHANSPVHENEIQRRSNFSLRDVNHRPADLFRASQQAEERARSDSNHCHDTGDFCRQRSSQRAMTQLFRIFGLNKRSQVSVVLIARNDAPVTK